MVIFAKIVDGGGGARDMEIQALDRILVAILNVVL